MTTTLYSKAARVHTTHPAPDVCKRVIPAPPKGTETPAARERRLYRQAAANGVRVRNNGDGTFTVPSQRRYDADGRPVKPYTVEAIAGIGWVCTCEHKLYHPGSVCAHICKVNGYLRRQAREEARQGPATSAVLELAYAAACAGDPLPAPIVDRAAADRAERARQADLDLFGEG